MSEYELLKQLSDGQCFDNPQVVKAHTEFLIALGKKVDVLNEKLDRFETIQIVNGNADGTPTLYKRNDFFQMLYDKTNPFKKMDKFNKRFDTIKKFVITILTLGYLLFTLFMYHQWQVEKTDIQKEIVKTLKEMNIGVQNRSQ